MCAVILQQLENKLVCGRMEGIVEMCMETPILGDLLEEFMCLPLQDELIKMSTARQPKLSFYVRDSSSKNKRRSSSLDKRTAGIPSDSQG